jgi:hypothetical protein
VFGGGAVVVAGRTLGVEEVVEGRTLGVGLLLLLLLLNVGREPPLKDGLDPLLKDGRELLLEGLLAPYMKLHALNKTTSARNAFFILSTSLKYTTQLRDLCQVILRRRL